MAFIGIGEVFYLFIYTLPLFSFQIFKDADKSAYVVEGTHHNEMLDIPEEYQSWQKYQGSAGHLINHGQEGNVDYTECWHPRFGRILCVQTLTDLT